MKSIFYALAAIILYGFAGVVIEQKLHGFNTIALTFLFTLPFIPLGLIFLSGQKIAGEEIAFPGGIYFWITMALGALFFLADYFYLGAFTSGGDVITITTILLMAPAVAAIVKHFSAGGFPNAYQIAGYIFVLAAMFLITKGSGSF